MRLLNPEPGEIVDRQTILQLKAKYGQSQDEQMIGSELLSESKEGRTSRDVLKGASKINIQPFLDEHEALQNHLDNNWFPDIGNKTEKQLEFDRLYENLLHVNEVIWKLEDQARVLRVAPDKFAHKASIMAAEVLFKINDMNDSRATLVKEINAIWGITRIEKLY